MTRRDAPGLGVETSRRSVLALGMILPVAALTALAASQASPAAVTAAPSELAPGASSFVPVGPARLADTRLEASVGGYTRLDANTIRVQVAGRAGVGMDASAGVLNVTATNTAAAGFITVYPAGTARPDASNVNVDRAGQTIANLVTVRLGAGAGLSGAIDVFTQNACDLVVDVNGCYTPVTEAVSAGRYVGLASAWRVLDTRRRAGGVGPGEIVRVDLGPVVPATARAVVVNLTVTESNGGGFWSGFAAGGAVPSSSSVNTDGAGQTRANQAILEVGAVGGVRGIDVYSSSGGHLVVDVAGYFSGSSSPAGSDGLFVPNAPYRTLDTRAEARYGRMYPGWVAEFDYAGRDRSQAVVVNVTATQARAAGFFTGYPARTDRPLASILNASYRGQTIANHAIVQTSTAGVAIFTQSGAALVVDVAGYFLGAPAAAESPAPVNVVPAPVPAALPYTISMPRLAKVATVVEGVGRDVVDAGYVGHWPGTGLAGGASHMVLFGHRTEFGGILRMMHLFVPGDEVVVEAGDGRIFRYGYARRDITDTSAANIYNAGLAAELPSLSLVGCTKTNFLPTDIRYRLVVTFSLIVEETA